MFQRILKSRRGRVPPKRVFLMRPPYDMLTAAVMGLSHSADTNLDKETDCDAELPSSPPFCPPVALFFLHILLNLLMPSTSEFIACSLSSYRSLAYAKDHLRISVWRSKSDVSTSQQSIARRRSPKNSKALFGDIGRTLSVLRIFPKHLRRLSIATTFSLASCLDKSGG